MTASLRTLGLLALLASFAATAENAPAPATGSPSLLGPAGYPAHQCTKPTLPAPPTGLGGPSETMMYNAQVRTFNVQITGYTQCINDYMATANADIERIQAQVTAAVNEANSR
jgi:hypothetical protein